MAVTMPPADRNRLASGAPGLSWFGIVRLGLVQTALGGFLLSIIAGHDAAFVPAERG